MPTPKTNDPFSELEINEDILKPEEQNLEELTIDPEALPALAAAKPPLADQRAPKHMRGKSLRREEEIWNYRIIPASSDNLYIKAGDKAKAKVMRTRFYNARSFLQWNHFHYVSTIDPHPAACWSIALAHTKEGWYLHFIRSEFSEADIVEELPK